MPKWTLVAVFLAAASPAFAQYNPAAAQSAPKEVVAVEKKDADGKVHIVREEREPSRDHYGNAAGNQFDLAVDGAFEGQTVAVLHFYTGEGFDFHLPKAALAQKGFSVYRWVNQAPSPAELRKGLAKASQLWIISDATQHLGPEHLEAIKEFFQAGHGVYVWGDNQPYYADANAVGRALFGATMSGDTYGGTTVPVWKRDQKSGPGVLRDHLLTTGLERLFEGITIATIAPNQSLKPLVYGSAGNLVTAVYEQDGRRAIFDGGFTRLYCNWDTAGTARYVKNAAAWLANAERFGAAVVARNTRKNVN